MILVSRVFKFFHAQLPSIQLYPNLCWSSIWWMGKIINRTQEHGHASWFYSITIFWSLPDDKKYTVSWIHGSHWHINVLGKRNLHMKRVLCEVPYVHKQAADFFVVYIRMLLIIYLVSISLNCGIDLQRGKLWCGFLLNSFINQCFIVALEHQSPC